MPLQASGGLASECRLRNHASPDVFGLTSGGSPSTSRSPFRLASPFAPFSIYHLGTKSLEGIGMGHYCRICGRQRPNEQFSGKGHKIHVCKRCKAIPKSQRQGIENMNDIFRFMLQSHISDRNVVRLEQMAKSENSQVATLARIVLKVARVKPYKTRRLKFLAQRYPELLQELQDTGLVLAPNWNSETAEHANSETAEISAGKDSETTSISVQDDWAIPF
jgi:hypothetical protein